MKSKTSLFNKAVFKRNLTGCFGLLAGLFVLDLIFLPVKFYAGLSDAARFADGDSLTAIRISNMPGMIWDGEWAFVLAVTAALTVAMFLFSYLFTARNSNMMHTYPVNRFSLFATNYVTGLLFLLVPLIVSVFLALLVGASFGAVTGEIAKSMFIWLGMIVVENVFFFSMSVCVLMFVGNMIAVPPLYFILNFLYMGVMMTIEWMVNAVSYGLETFSLESWAGLGRILSPVYCFMSFNLFKGETENGQLMYSSSEAKILFIYLAAAVVFIVIAVAAYEKKHIETAGDVITVNWLKPIFRWGAAVCTSSVCAVAVNALLFRESFAAILVSVIVIGAVVFFIAQMLLERSVHVFQKKRGLECLVYTVLICVVYIALDADVFGMEKLIPQASEVKDIWVAGEIQLYTEDSGEIAWVEDIHKQIIDSKKEFEQTGESLDSLSYFSIIYEMKDGSRVRRSYEIPRDEAAGSVFRQIEEYGKRPDVVLRRYFGAHYPNVEVYGGYWDDSQGTRSRRISEADTQKIYQAFEEDVRAGRLDADEDALNDTVYYGSMQLDVRDEAGFISPMFQGTYSYGWSNEEGIAEIYVESQMTSLVKVMKELDYIQDEDEDR